MVPAKAVVEALVEQGARHQQRHAGQVEGDVDAQQDGVTPRSRQACQLRTDGLKAERDGHLRRTNRKPDVDALKHSVTTHVQTTAHKPHPPRPRSRAHHIRGIEASDKLTPSSQNDSTGVAFHIVNVNGAGGRALGCTQAD